MQGCGVGGPLDESATLQDDAIVVIGLGVAMSTYETKLIARDIVAADTMIFEFERPQGFDFKAGQAIDVTLVETEVAEAKGARHTFSIVSAPFENKLAIATRMRAASKFKLALKRLMVGTPVRIEGPYGSLTLHDNSRRAAVMIAGGIGITPFLSMARQATNDQSPHYLMLVDSNRRPEDAPFLSELTQLERLNVNFRLVATMTQASKSNIHWNGRTGPIDENLLQQVTGHFPEPVYYVAGPPMFVEAMRATLTDMGIAESSIHSEDFFGY
jgi:ferredoxin-NADP reductase